MRSAVFLPYTCFETNLVYLLHPTIFSALTVEKIRLSAATTGTLIFIETRERKDMPE
jgi:hypothetical protein